MESQKCEMSAKHAAEWSRFRDEILTPLYQRVAGGDEKNAKALADILKICQEGERKAYAFGEDQSQEGAGGLEVCFEGD